VELPAAAVDVLRKVRAAQAERCLKLGVPFDPAGYVFDSPHDEPGRRPLDVDVITKHFRKLMRKAGLSINVHSLRHSHATLLLAAGEHPKVVQERLGHSTVSLTLQVYSHTLPTMGRRAADRFTEFIASSQ